MRSNKLTLLSGFICYHGSEGWKVQEGFVKQIQCEHLLTQNNLRHKTYLWRIYVVNICTRTCPLEIFTNESFFIFESRRLILAEQYPKNFNHITSIIQFFNDA